MQSYRANEIKINPIEAATNKKDGSINPDLGSVSFVGIVTLIVGAMVVVISDPESEE